MKNYNLQDHLFSNSDLMILTFNFLDSEYNTVVVKLSDQINLSWVDLQAQLISFESRLDQLNNFSGLTLNASANFASKTDFKGNKFHHEAIGESNFRGMGKGQRKR